VHPVIEAVDKSVRDWVKSVVKGVDVVLDAPCASADKPAIHLHLLEVQSAVPANRDHPRSVELMLNYLVTVAAAETEVAHRVFGNLLAAALGRSEYEVELPQLGPEFWTAFGVAPRPAFFLKCPLTVSREQQVPRIREAPEIRLKPAAVLSGVVVTSNDLPVVRARVELPEVHAVTYTDEGGRFSFNAAPPRSGPRAFKVTAKGSERVFSDTAPADAPLVIRFDLKET
jgi:hypothetical protein